MAMTEIGEIGIHVDGRELILRPSLAAMARLGDGAELVRVFDLLHRLPALATFPARWIARARHRQFLAAVDVLQACTVEDITELTGRPGSRWGAWIAGRIPPAIMLHLARSLMRHGLVGEVPPDDRYETPEAAEAYTSEFQAAEVAAMAMAHLGYSEPDAWNLTVTGLTRAMRAKFPPPPRKAPTKREFADTMAWLDQINGGRT